MCQCTYTCYTKTAVNALALLLNYLVDILPKSVQYLSSLSIIQQISYHKLCSCLATQLQSRHLALTVQQTVRYYIVISRCQAINSQYTLSKCVANCNLKFMNQRAENKLLYLKVKNSKSNHLLPKPVYVNTSSKSDIVQHSMKNSPWGLCIRQHCNKCND